MLGSYEKTELVSHLRSWARESDQKDANVVPGMYDMVDKFADLIEAQNEAIDNDKRKGAALIKFADKWLAFVAKMKVVETYIWPVQTAVAELREFPTER